MKARNLTVATVPEQGMKTDDFSAAQAAASRVFGRDKDAKVIFAGDQAHVRADGTIVFPALNEGSQMTKKQVLVARGYNDHETGHKRYTHLPTTKKFVEHCKRTDNQLLKQTGNAIDDLRIEKLAIRDYSGAQTNLEAASDAVYAEYMEHIKENPDDAKELDITLPLMITAEGRRRMGYKSDYIDDVLASIPADQLQKVRDFVDIAEQCKNPDPEIGTKEVVEVAKKVIKMKDEVEQEEQQEGNVPFGSGDGEGEGDGGIAGLGDDEGGGGDDRHNGGRNENTGGEDIKKGNDGEVTEAGGGGKNDPLDIENLKKASLLENFKAHVVSDADNYRPYSTEYDDYSSIEDGNMSEYMREHATLKKYEDIVHQMHGKISTMARKLERALLSMQRRDWQNNTEFGTLDPKRLPQVAVGRHNVFRLREDRKELDTAVSMLIDLSGSMHGYKAYLAQQVSIAISLVLEKVGVPFEVLGFHNNVPSYYGHSRRKERSYPGNDTRIPKEWSDEMQATYYREDPMYSRFEPVQMYEFKGYDQRLVQARLGMSVISDCVGGNNSDPDAVKVAIQHLKARTEKRRVLFVLSDGQPAAMTSYDSFNHLGQHLRNRIDDVVRLGMECVGIGICSDAVRKFYPHHVVVNDLDELPKAAFDQLAKILVSERYKVDNSDLITATRQR